MKKVFESVTNFFKDFSEYVTKFNTASSFESNKTLDNLNDKLSEIMNDRVILASYLLSPLSKITDPEHTSQFKLVKDSSSNRVNDLLLNKTKPVTLYNDLLTFRDTDKKVQTTGRSFEKYK